MAQEPLNRPPDPTDPYFTQWIYQLWKRVSQAGQIAWTQITSLPTLISQLAALSAGTANQILGENAAASNLEFKTLTAGSNVTITNGVGTVTIASTGGGGASLNNIISTPTTIAADTSYPIVEYLTIQSDLTIAGNLLILNGSGSSGTTSQSPNLFFASPNGSSGTPFFRAIVSTDVPTLNQSTTGNANTATTATTANSLTTPRTINGTSFDGSANITITADASTLTGVTLNSTVVSSSLTSIGIQTGAVLSSGTAGVGYSTGAGGTVTQATDKTTGVTLNKITGQITMQATSLAASTTVSFVLTNSTIAATDLIILNHKSVGTFGSYTLNGRAASGSASIDVRNVSLGSLSEAIVIGYAVIKAVTA